MGHRVVRGQRGLLKILSDLNGSVVTVGAGKQTKIGRDIKQRQNAPELEKQRFVGKQGIKGGFCSVVKNQTALDKLRALGRKKARQENAGGCQQGKKGGQRQQGNPYGCCKIVENLDIQGK